MKSGLIKRYFDMPDGKAVLELDIIPSSPAVIATEKIYGNLQNNHARNKQGRI